MKVLLIAPTIDEKIRTAKGLLSPALGLYFLKGLTPPEYEVKIVEEEIEDLNLDEECDLVGISCMTSTAPRAYELAQKFRKKGKKIILGGFHPSIMPDEALKFADSVIVGEAEDVWGDLLIDFEKDELKKIYKSSLPDLKKFIPLDYKKLRRGPLKSMALITTRGCPYACEFCSIKEFYGKKIRHLPIANIVRYIRESGAKFINFQDDNIFGDQVFARNLFEALIPLKIKWTSQGSLSIADNKTLLDLAVKSGCVGLLIGLESISEVQLSKLNKSYKKIEKVEEALKIIRKAGIPFIVSVVFGFDTDTKETFNQTLKFLIKNNIGAASFLILTPYPNLNLFDELKNSGRLLSTDWKYYGSSTAVFKPKNMSALELQSEMTRIRKEFYSYESILKRLMGNLRHPFVFLAVNLAWRQELKIRNLDGNNLNLPFLQPDF